jgi:hypothetical protein
MTTTGTETASWMEIDARVVALGARRGALDVEIGESLLAARDAQVHRHLGRGSFAEYVEWRLQIDPHSLAERMRVAEALAQLGEIREALRGGEVSWSAAREVTRVAVPETEGEWLDAVRGKRAGDVQDLVSGRRPGQRPSDPADPRLRRHGVHLDFSGETYAMFRELIRVKRKEDPSLSEDEILRAAFRSALGGPGDDGRAPYQVAITRCDDCGRVWQEARGQSIELTPEAAERIRCDEQVIGDPSQVGRAGDRSHVGRASQQIPPAMRRQVMRRDKGRCRVPGCRNATFLDVHHVILREEGGRHEMENLAVLCEGHHTRMHEGRLHAERDGAGLRFFHPDGTEYGAAPSTEMTGLFEKTFRVLRSMQFKETETKRAIEAIRSHVGRDATLEDAVRAALGVLTDGVVAHS